MLYSGALSVAPHNRVDADATSNAPPQRRRDPYGFSPFNGVNHGKTTLTGAHDAELKS
jgi:hypothetical protein